MPDDDFDALEWLDCILGDWAPVVCRPAKLCGHFFIRAEIAGKHQAPSGTPRYADPDGTREEAAKTVSRQFGAVPELRRLDFSGIVRVEGRWRRRTLGLEFSEVARFAIVRDPPLLVELVAKRQWDIYREPRARLIGAESSAGEAVAPDAPMPDAATERRGRGKDLIIECLLDNKGITKARILQAVQQTLRLSPGESQAAWAELSQEHPDWKLAEGGRRSLKREAEVRSQVTEFVKNKNQK